MTAREKAIALFRRVYNDAEKLDEQTAADLVDALIDAVRAPESAYTRALGQWWECPKLGCTLTAPHYHEAPAGTDVDDAVTFEPRK